MIAKSEPGCGINSIYTQTYDEQQIKSVNELERNPVHA
jgi:hypothetical protein